MADDDYTPATLLAELRARLGLGRERLAHLLKITIQRLAMWESGAAKPTRSDWGKMEGVVKRYGSDVQDMLEPVQRMAEKAPEKW